MRSPISWIVAIIVFILVFVGTQIGMTAIGFEAWHLGGLGGTAFVLVRIYATIWLAGTLGRLAGGELRRKNTPGEEQPQTTTAPNGHIHIDHPDGRSERISIASPEQADLAGAMAHRKAITTKLLVPATVIPAERMSPMSPVSLLLVIMAVGASIFITWWLTVQRNELVKLRANVLRIEGRLEHFEELDSKVNNGSLRIGDLESRVGEIEDAIETYQEIIRNEIKPTRAGDSRIDQLESRLLDMEIEIETQ